MPKKTETKKTVGRPKTEIDLKIAKNLGFIHATLDECSAVLEVNKNTLATHNEFQTAYKNGKEQGKRSLRRLMWKHAKTSVPAAIFLAKNLLGMRDNPEDVNKSHEIIGFDFTEVK